MTFRRTASGLKSVHIFYGVDVVAFCEGGGSLTAAHIFQDTVHETLDTAFWKAVYSLVQATKKVHFKSIGSKSVLKDILSDIKRESLSNITLCLDRDYDWLNSSQEEHARVVYTYGYSWESDVSHPAIVCDLVRRVLGENVSAERVCDLIVQSLNHQRRSMARWCEMDLALVGRGGGALIERDKSMKYIDVRSSPPLLNSAAAQARLRELGYSRGPMRQIRIDPTEVHCMIYGKFYSRYVHSLFLHYLKSHQSKSRMEYDLFVRLLISEMKGHFRGRKLSLMRRYFRKKRNAF